MYKPSISNNKLTTLLIITTAFILSACGSTSNQSISTNHIPKPNPNPKKFFNIPANHPTSQLVRDMLTVSGDTTTYPADINELHGMTVRSAGILNHLGTIFIETIKKPNKQQPTNTIFVRSYSKNFKLLAVPLVLPHFQIQSGALYGAKVEQIQAQPVQKQVQPVYKKTNELDFNTLPRGKAQYQGRTIAFNNAKTRFDIGSITLNADFDSKNISGNINRADGTQIELQQTSITNDNGKAKYSGNAKTNINNVDKTGTYEGNFFGHYLSRRASDTVGKVTFADPDDYLSSGFGAQRKRK